MRNYAELPKKYTLKKTDTLVGEINEYTWRAIRHDLNNKLTYIIRCTYESGHSNRVYRLTSKEWAEVLARAASTEMYQECTDRDTLLELAVDYVAEVYEPYIITNPIF